MPVPRVVLIFKSHQVHDHEQSCFLMVLSLWSDELQTALVVVMVFIL